MTQEKPFLDIINDYLDSENTRLPVFDGIGLRIQEEISEEDPDIGRLENLITSDQALTGQVLKTANSAFYKGLIKVSTVREAIVRLGMEEISNIVILLGQRRNFVSKDPLVQGLMKTLWQHSVCCASASKWLSKRCGFHSISHQAFVAGLLHDVGKLFLLTVIESMNETQKQGFHPPAELLNEIMNSLHSEHGHSLLSNWNLPEIYCNVARDHHVQEFNSNDSLLLIVRMANMACNKIGIGLNIDDSILLGATSEAHHLGISEVIIAELQIAVEDALALAA
jgi:HD-like signal output (HDOD) protein